MPSQRLATKIGNYSFWAPDNGRFVARKHVEELRKIGIINSTTRLILVGSFFEINSKETVKITLQCTQYLVHKSNINFLLVGALQSAWIHICTAQTYIYIYIHTHTHTHTHTHIDIISCGTFQSVERLEGKRPKNRINSLLPLGVRNLYVLKSVENGTGSHPASYSGGTWSSFPGGKAAAEEIWHSPPPSVDINPLNPELNPICYLLALLGAHHFLHVSRIRVKLLTFRLLMSYIYGAPILDVSRSHTTTQHSR